MSDDGTRYPGMFQSARKKYAKLIAPIRAVAKDHGYAIAVHGSLNRDIDIVAVPWIDRAFTEQKLVVAIIDVCKEYNNGFASCADIEKPTLKPHGRHSYVIVVGEGVYIDLCVMPQIAKPDETPT